MSGFLRENKIFIAVVVAVAGLIAAVIFFTYSPNIRPENRIPIAIVKTASSSSGFDGIFSIQTSKEEVEGDFLYDNQARILSVNGEVAVKGETPYPIDFIYDFSSKEFNIDKLHSVLDIELWENMLSQAEKTTVRKEFTINEMKQTVYMDCYTVNLSVEELFKLFRMWEKSEVIIAYKEAAVWEIEVKFFVDEDDYMREVTVASDQEALKWRGIIKVENLYRESDVDNIDEKYLSAT